MEKFNAVFKIQKDGKYGQAMQDLPGTEKDCRAIRKAAKKYGATDNGDGTYTLKDTEANHGNYRKIQRSILTRLRAKPEKKYLIIYCFAGHGMNENGRQVFLVNEFDERTTFYKLCNVENYIRQYAEDYQNSY